MELLIELFINAGENSSGQDTDSIQTWTWSHRKCKFIQTKLLYKLRTLTFIISNFNPEIKLNHANSYKFTVQCM